MIQNLNSNGTDAEETTLLSFSDGFTDGITVV